MTGEEIINYIRKNHLEDYTFVVQHETGDGYSDVRYLEIDEDYREVAVV